MIFCGFTILLLYTIQIIKNIQQEKNFQLNLKMETECPLCENQYSDENPPRLLVGCGHTFCDKCFGKMMTENKGSYVIICPEDGEMVTLKNNNVSNIPKNIALLKIIQSKKNNSSFKDPQLEMSKIVKSQQVAPQDDDARDLVDAIASSNNVSGSEQKITIQKDEKQQQTKIDIHQQKQKPIKQQKKPKQQKKQKQQKKIKEQKKVKQQKVVQMCKTHQKPLEVVCVMDLKKICVNCAIFGEHKGHQFKSLQEIQNQRMAYYSAILEIMEKKQTVSTRISNEQTCSSIMQLLAKKKSKIKSNINENFKKLLQSIQAKQKESLRNLDSLMLKAETKLKNLMKIDPQLLQKYDGWEEKSFQQIKILEGNNFQAKLQLIFSDSADETDVLEAGDLIVQEMNKQEENLINQVELALQNIGVDFTLDVYNYIDGFVDIYQQAKKKKLKTRTVKAEPQINPPILHQQSSGKFASSAKKQQLGSVFKQQFQTQKIAPVVHIQQEMQKTIEKKQFKQIHSLGSHEENLLQIQFQPSSVKKPQFIKTQQIHIETQIVVDSPLRKQKDALSPSNKAFEKTQGFVSGQISPRMSRTNNTFKKEQQSFVSDKAEKPNKKKIMTKLKLPEKYQKILDGILNDQLDLVDFTNAELGDSTIVAISQLIAGTKAKTVKLIRNKLTDEAIVKILPNMKGVITLNLSQNQLTEKCLDYIIQKRGDLESIKSIILSQNKIMERKAKAKIQKLKSLEIVISI